MTSQKYFISTKLKENNFYSTDPFSEIYTDKNTIEQLFTTRSSAISEGLRNTLVSINPAATKTSHLKMIAIDK